MKEILYAVLVLGIMGAVFGAVLAIASKVFAVKTDERLPKLVEALPGAMEKYRIEKLSDITGGAHA